MNGVNELKDKVIVYDDNCPMCRMYTHQFIKRGILPQGNRLAYSDLHGPLSDQIDHKRYKLEIALVDRSGGQTMYGVDGLFYILGHRWPVLNGIFEQQWFYNKVKSLYRFISYNRKIIAPFKLNPDAPDCTPPFHFRYRLQLIILGVVMATLFTAIFGVAVHNIMPGSSYLGIMAKMILICGSGWFLQIMGALFFMKKDAINYIAHLAVIMMMGSFILLTALAGMYLLQLVGLPAIWQPIIAVSFSFMLMLDQHRSRIAVMKKSQRWTLAWVLNLASTAIAFWFYFN